MFRLTLICIVYIGLHGCAVDYPGEPLPGSAKADGADAADPAADPAEPTFLDRLPRWGRYIVLDELERIVPAYLAETRAVLARIDALPAGTVAETTALNEIPIPDLFATGDLALRAVLDETDFGGGRRDHDVAWLRQSAVDLEAFDESIRDAVRNGTNPPEFDEHLTNESFWRGDEALEINAGIRAVSRYYCNIDIRVSDYPGDGFRVEAYETCD